MGVDNVSNLVQSAYMNKNAAVTIRLPLPLKRRLEARAKEKHRSLSAQLVHDLKTVVDQQPEEVKSGKFLGLYRGSRIPTDDDIKQVRSLLWGNLGLAQE